MACRVLNLAPGVRSTLHARPGRAGPHCGAYGAWKCEMTLRKSSNTTFLSRRECCASTCMRLGASRPPGSRPASTHTSRTLLGGMPSLGPSPPASATKACMSRCSCVLSRVPDMACACRSGRPGLPSAVLRTCLAPTISPYTTLCGCSSCSFGSAGSTLAAAADGASANISFSSAVMGATDPHLGWSRTNSPSNFCPLPTW
mmetsp:Transcript_15562/g.53165  ORF Transcript_15562/g.53165 Transcript_15562/m.53165 type:complete len:201 (-) Transcript_15562:351-953(-)